ncbi:hypothetical protein [Butyricimonas faecihominis]
MTWWLLTGRKGSVFAIRSRWWRCWLTGRWSRCRVSCSRGRERWMPWRTTRRG